MVYTIQSIVQYIEIYANIQTAACFIRTIVTVIYTVAQLVGVNAALTGTLELAEKTLPRLRLACSTIKSLTPWCVSIMLMTTCLDVYL